MPITITSSLLAFSGVTGLEDEKIALTMSRRLGGTGGFFESASSSLKRLASNF